MRGRDAARPTPTAEEPWRRVALEIRGAEYQQVIRAINAHDDLLEALKDARAVVAGRAPDHDLLIARIDAALAKAVES